MLLFNEEVETQLIFLCRETKFHEMNVKLDPVHTSFIKCWGSAPPGPHGKVLVFMSVVYWKTVSQSRQRGLVVFMLSKEDGWTGWKDFGFKNRPPLNCEKLLGFESVGFGRSWGHITRHTIRAPIKVHFLRTTRPGFQSLYLHNKLGAMGDGGEEERRQGVCLPAG